MVLEDLESYPIYYNFIFQILESQFAKSFSYPLNLLQLSTPCCFLPDPNLSWFLTPAWFLTYYSQSGQLNQLMLVLFVFMLKDSTEDNTFSLCPKVPLSCGSQCISSLAALESILLHDQLNKHSEQKKPFQYKTQNKFLTVHTSFVSISYTYQ